MAPMLNPVRVYHSKIVRTTSASAYYQVVEAEAEVVRTIFEWYTRTGFSIGAITRELNQRRIPTRTGRGRWERSTVWGILGNPAYPGRACFGTTGMRLRQRITPPRRQHRRPSPRYKAHYD